MGTQSFFNTRLGMAMKHELNEKKPREFIVGDKITLKDFGKIHLESDEQVTFVTDTQKEYDVCKKNWGFYATPSINNRLKKFGFKTALTKNLNSHNRYIMLVEEGKEHDFYSYLEQEDMIVESWLA